MDSSLFDLVQEQSKSNIVQQKKAQTDDDFVDRINRKLTPIILSVFSIMLCAKQFVVGSPLQLWPPKEFSGDWVQYATDYCWVKNTYYVPVNGSIPTNPEDRKKAELRYYQWVPFVLAIQALMFLIPNLIWKSIRHISGMDIKAFVNMAMEATTVDPVSRESNVRMIARHMKACLYSDWDSDCDGGDRHKRLGIFSFMHGLILSILYIVVKLLYVANIICQFLILQSFLGIGNDGSFFGFKLFNDILNGKDWQITGAFPRVTMCDFEVSGLGQKRKYTLQCVLVINLFNEKIYIFIWFWLTFIGIITILSLLMWLGWFLIPAWRQKTIYKYIERNEGMTDKLLKETNNKALLSSNNIIEDKKKLLVDDVLRSDGLFMLRMVANNAGEPVVNDVVMALWLDYAGIKSLHDEADHPEQPGDTTDHGHPSPEDEDSHIDHDRPQTSYE